jgi:hypothetical protein
MIRSESKKNEGAYLKKIKQQIKGVPPMEMSKFAIDFVIAFAVILMVSMIVTFLYNLLVYRTSMVDGESSFRLALIVGISRSLLHQRDKK